LPGDDSIEEIERAGLPVIRVGLLAILIGLSVIRAGLAVIRPGDLWAGEAAEGCKGIGTLMP
jgi:hypothetical protein